VKGIWLKGIWQTEIGLTEIALIEIGLGPAARWHLSRGDPLTRRVRRESQPHPTAQLVGHLGATRHFDRILHRCAIVFVSHDQVSAGESAS